MASNPKVRNKEVKKHNPVKNKPLIEKTNNLTEHVEKKEVKSTIESNIEALNNSTFRLNYCFNNLQKLYNKFNLSLEEKRTCQETEEEEISLEDYSILGQLEILNRKFKRICLSFEVELGQFKNIVYKEVEVNTKHK